MASSSWWSCFCASALLPKSAAAAKPSASRLRILFPSMMNSPELSRADLEPDLEPGDSRRGVGPGNYGAIDGVAAQPQNVPFRPKTSRRGKTAGSDPSHFSPLTSYLSSLHVPSPDPRLRAGHLVRVGPQP